MKVTAVLIRYKRLKELEQVIEHLKVLDFIDEIIVHDNTKVNMNVYGRYLGALRAKNDVIYVQDEDCIVNNIREMYELFDGRTLVNAVKLDRRFDYQGHDSLVGWGAFFKKDWVAVFESYKSMYGEDAFMHREADRIFTGLQNRPRITVDADIDEFPCAMEDALSLQPTHMYTREIARERVECLRKELYSMNVL